MNPEELIRRLRLSIESRNQVMEELFLNNDLRNNCIKFVMAKGGSREDAETVFCEAIINLVKSCNRVDFNIHSTLENYLFGETRNVWYRTLRERKKNNPTTDNLPEGEDRENPEILLITSEKKEVLLQILAKLDDKCRQVLTLWAHNMKMKAIAIEMNYSSAEVVRKKKHFCLKKLIRLVGDDPSGTAVLNPTD